MPRISRENSKTITQTYHLIIRGINKQDIFFDDYDKKKFLKEIERTKEKYQYEIYAYVLMNNHVHITIFDKNDNKSNVVHSICTSYAEYFNKKYETIEKAIWKMIKVDSNYRYVANNKIIITKEGIEWLSKNCFKYKYLELLENYKMELTEKYNNAGYIYDNFFQKN